MTCGWALGHLGRDHSQHNRNLKWQVDPYFAIKICINSLLLHAADTCVLCSPPSVSQKAGSPL